MVDSNVQLFIPLDAMHRGGNRLHAQQCCNAGNECQNKLPAADSNM
jgi:hypothetical protein